jgi:plasmid stabilization system protein ParE
MGHLRRLPRLTEAVRRLQHELEVPGAAATMGEQCKGGLRRCRKVRVGSSHRMIFLVRQADVVVLAVWYRDELAAYTEARRALKEPLPTSLTP